jgi:hypothetical protein
MRLFHAFSCYYPIPFQGIRDQHSPQKKHHILEDPQNITPSRVTPGPAAWIVQPRLGFGMAKYATLLCPDLRSTDLFKHLLMSTHMTAKTEKKAGMLSEMGWIQESLLIWLVVWNIFYFSIYWE